MRLGFVSAVVPELSPDEVIGLAAAEGFGCVELMCWPVGEADRKYAGVTHVDVANLTQVRADEIRAACADRGIAISGLGYYPNPLDPDPAVGPVAIHHLERVIAAAPLLGVRTVNTFVGRDWRLSIEDNWHRFLDVWRPIVQHAEDHDVRIGIENCPMLFTRDEWPGGKNLFVSPVVWRRAFADLGSGSIGLNFDPSHLALQDMDPVGPLEEFKDRLFHVHAKDVRIDRAAVNERGRFDFPNRWHAPRIPGYGEIDWPRFMGELTRVGYEGPVCIEVEDETFGTSLDGRRRALKVARNVLATFFG